MKKRSINALTHIMIWSAFLVLLFLFMPFYDIALLQYPVLFFGMFGLIILYYYFNSNFLVPRFLARKKIVLYVVCNLLIMMVCTYLSEVSDWLRPPDPVLRHRLFAPVTDEFGLEPPPPLLSPDKPNEQGIFPNREPMKVPTNSLLIFLLVFTVSTGTRIIAIWLDIENKRSKAENEKSRAELSALKAQINPHFLFNTLNSIYYLAMQKSEETPETIMKLSDLMRFVLTETEVDYIPLNKEIDCVTQYIGLQALRLTKKTTVGFKVGGDVESHIISPLLLLPFVENAFKYGVSTHVNSHISIELFVEKNELNFFVENKKERVREIQTTGIGLNNVVRRLELIYPEKYQLDISENGNSYNVYLKIELA